MKSIPYIFIIILLVVIFFQRECNSDNQTQVVTSNVFDTIIDTVYLESTSYVPLPIYHDTGSTLILYHSVDTAAILSDYFSRYYYCDTIQNDSVASIIICDTVSRNKIVFRKPMITLYPRTIINTNFLLSDPVPNRKLSVGVQATISSKVYGLSPTIIYQSKKETSISFSYDIVNKSYSFGVFFPLRFKQR